MAKSVGINIIRDCEEIDTAFLLQLSWHNLVFFLAWRFWLNFIWQSETFFVDEFSSTFGEQELNVVGS